MFMASYPISPTTQIRSDRPRFPPPLRRHGCVPANNRLGGTAPPYTNVAQIAIPQAFDHEGIFSLSIVRLREFRDFSFLLVWVPRPWLPVRAPSNLHRLCHFMM